MELAGNKNLFQTVFDSASNGIAVMESFYDENGRVKDFEVLLFNAYTHNWIGNIDYKGKLYGDLFPTVKETGILARFIEVAETGISASFERKYGGEGMNHWFSFTAVKQDQLLVVTTQDISESKQSEANLADALDASQKQQRLYDSITSTTPDLVYVFTLDYKFEYANKALLSMWGVSWEYANGKGLRELGYEEWHAKMHEEEIDQIVALKEPVRGSVSFPHALLGKRIYDYILAPVFDEFGEVEAVAGTTRDITDLKKAEDALRESESYFSQLTDTVPAIIWITDQDGRCTYLNHHWFDYTGQTPQEAEGFGWLDATHPDDKDEAGKILLEANQAQKPFSLLYRLRNKTGEYHWAKDSGSPKFSKDGIYEGFIGTVVDVHEEKLSQEKVSASQARLSNVIDTSPVGTAILTGPEMKVEVANDVIINFWNRDRSVIGKPLTESIPELIGQPFPKILETVYSTGIAHIDNEALAYFLNKEGGLTPIYFNYSYTALRDAEGIIYGVLIMAIDVTQEILSRKQVEESESRFRMLSDEMPQFVWTGHASGQFAYFNKAFYSYTGLLPQEITVVDWLQIVHPQDLEATNRLWQQSIRTGEDFILEHRFKGADEMYRWQLSRAVPQKDAHGVIQQWIGTSTDIDGQKSVEEQLEKLVRDRTRELRRSNEDLQQFAHVASHDLQEPVRKIKIFTDRLQKHLADHLDADATRFIEKIQSASDRISTMISGVLTYSNINSGIQNRENTDLNEVLKSIETDLEVKIQATGTKIRWDSLPTLEGAPVLLYQLFYNLILNSIKFVASGTVPQITITSELKADEGQVFAYIMLQDNGIGFNNEFAEQIFETFTRLNSKDSYEGTGLGLSLCKKIVERHGGSIAAASKLGEGARFTIILPLQQKNSII